MTVPAPEAGDELIGELSDTGILGSSEEKGVLRLYWDERTWDAGIPALVRRLLAAQGTGCTEDSVAVDIVLDRDWNVLWTQSARPVRVGRRLLIRQSWNPVEVQLGTIQLIIDPKRAFGTGFHATTQLLLEWLEDLVLRGRRVLDVGTGSGILAMAALRLGAANALGIDTDPEAIECALENAQVNGFADELEFRAVPVDCLGIGQFDVVLANLDRNVILRSSAAIAGAIRTEGRLLVTGIQDQDVADIVRAFADLSCRLSGRREKEEWAALELRPTPGLCALKSPAPSASVNYEGRSPAQGFEDSESPVRLLLRHIRSTPPPACNGLDCVPP